MQQQKIPTWFQQSVATGLAQLVCLGFDGMPANDVFVAGTLPAWLRFLWPARSWSESDRALIDEGFATLGGSARRWPVPRDLLDCIPQPRALAAACHAQHRARARELTSDEAQARIRALLAECKKRLDEDEAAAIVEGFRSRCLKGGRHAP